MKMWSELHEDTARSGERGASYNPDDIWGGTLRFTKRFRGGERVHRVTTYYEHNGTRGRLTSEPFRQLKHARAYLAACKDGRA